MTKLARIQAWDRARGGDSDSRAGGVRPLRYCAFLSYSHADEEIAGWLHDALEKFRTPSSLAGRLTEIGAIPDRLVLARGGRLALGQRRNRYVQAASAGRLRVRRDRFRRAVRKRCAGPRSRGMPA